MLSFLGLFKWGFGLYQSNQLQSYRYKVRFSLLSLFLLSSTSCSHFFSIFLLFISGIFYLRRNRIGYSCALLPYFIYLFLFWSNRIFYPSPNFTISFISSSLSSPSFLPSFLHFLIFIPSSTSFLPSFLPLQTPVSPGRITAEPLMYRAGLQLARDASVEELLGNLQMYVHSCCYTLLLPSLGLQTD